MKTTKETKTLIHKFARIDAGESESQKTLQELLLAAFGNAPSAFDRQEPIDETGDLKRVIGSFKEDREVLLGHLLMYEKGMDITYLTENETEKGSFEVRRASLKSIDTLSGADANERTQDDAKIKEVLQGALFFGVADNHVIFLQSQVVNERRLELHLNWLLKDCTNLLDGTGSVTLTNQPAKSVVETIKAAKVKEVSLGTPVQISSTMDGASGSLSGSSDSSVEVVTHKVSGGFELLKNYMSTMLRDDSEISNLTNDSNLEVFIKVRYLNKTDKNGETFLDKLAIATRNFDPEDTTIELKGGGKIRGDELRLSKQVRVGAINKVLEKADVYDNIVKWIEELLESGEID